MKNVVLDEVLKERIIESNIFTEKEQKKIKEDYLLYLKCYCIGILDREVSIGN